MTLILIVITNQIKHIRINKKEIHKRINKRHNKRLAIKERQKGVYSLSYMLVLKRYNNASYYIMIE